MTVKAYLSQESTLMAAFVTDELIASENNKQRVIRYLRALAIPLAAAQFLVHYCHKLSPFSPGLEAFTVYATSSTITQGHIWEFKNGFLRHFRYSDEEKEEINQALSALKFRYNGSAYRGYYYGAGMLCPQQSPRRRRTPAAIVFYHTSV
ncbi:hypothetical protein BD311DRAFT_566669 [Dichomitus squalens]|uniref:Uncharacterized protein n=1 Tax=Dichomitus squalens TaxID=114155 RepID=A0A4Q9MDW6_9APHY|nr:hypothetical protein BD311DRAFT_566669 [Dichomitus squalens]